MRASDVVARLGGDEFAVLMWNVGEPQAVAKARDLEKRIEQIEPRARAGAAERRIGASGRSSVAQLDAADRAMYRRQKERVSPIDAADKAMYACDINFVRGTGCRFRGADTAAVIA